MRVRQLISLTVLSIALLPFAIGSAAGEPVNLPDLLQSGDTEDGWRVSLSMTQLINSVPNMAATPFTHEGFISTRVHVTVDGDGKMPVNSGFVVVGVQLGCKVKLDEGMDLGTGNQLDVLSGDPYVNLTPSIGLDLRPGYIRTVGLGAKPLKGRTATISVRDAHVQIDGCGGQVAARLFASVRISTDTSDDSLNVYGDLLPL